MKQFIQFMKLFSNIMNLYQFKVFMFKISYVWRIKTQIKSEHFNNTNHIKF